MNPPRFFRGRVDRFHFWVAVAGALLLLALFVARSVVRMRMNVYASRSTVERLLDHVDALEIRIRELEAVLPADGER